MNNNARDGSTRETKETKEKLWPYGVHEESEPATLLRSHPRWMRTLIYALPFTSPRCVHSLLVIWPASSTLAAVPALICMCEAAYRTVIGQSAFIGGCPM